MVQSMSYPALFLDRDGVINKENGYIDSTLKIEFLESIFDLCRFFKQKNFKVVVATNQSGIGKGLISLKQYHEINSYIVEKFKNENCALDLILTASFDPNSGSCDDEEIFLRKPNPGMILRAKSILDLDLNKSLLIGDNLTDMEAGKKASLPRLYLIKNPPLYSDYFETFVDLQSCLVRLKHEFDA